MQAWTLSLRTTAESGLPSVDVAVQAREEATVADLARAFGQHLAPGQEQLLLVPVAGGQPWPAGRRVAECGLRTGDLLDVVPAPVSWLGHGGADARPRAVLRVVSGPDHGRRLAVSAAAVTLGRGAGCSFRLSDPLVSQRHARILLGTRPVVHDEGSAHGTFAGGEPVLSGREVDWGTPIRLGTTTVVVEPGDAPPPEPVVSVFRSPRFGDPLAEGELDVPAPPSRQRPTPLPWMMMALPMVMGAAMLMRAVTAYALVYMLAWPVLGYLGWRQQRRGAERQFRADVRSWRQDVDEILATLDEAARQQRRRLLDDYPAPDAVQRRAASRDPVLWTRNPERAAFLTTRVGLGPVPALLRAEVQDGGDRDVRREAVADVAERASLAAMPVLADLSLHDLTALTGPPDAVDALARSMMLRLTVDHAPADLTIAGCFGPARRHHEAWLRWLPHAAVRPGGAPPVAIGPNAAVQLLDHLVTEGGDTGHTVCFVDEDAGIPRRTVEAVAAGAAARRLHLVWLGRQAHEVPAATDLLVDLSAGMVGLGDRGGVRPLETVDGMSLDHAWRTARAMTAYVDEAAVLPASTAIPAVVRLPDLSSDLEDLDDVEAVLRRWSQSAGLRAQIGSGLDGVVTVDLREDGPHGLVAGTTGSGKSELLQSLICSLALNNPPSRISFLLVDYKGGAAFRECADLPHTVGYITDLTPALVQRALVSLGAEIAAREQLLERYAAKDLVALERDHPEAAPPSLLICVDEFAALTAEVPDFVDGMVNIAQRGRSLGLHLLLATQRPAGVVTGNIRANADLRIALRVSSDDDSRDVIDSADAARISRATPGRAWVRRTGHGTAELVQAAWTGAQEPLDAAAVPVRVRPFSAATTERATVETGLDPRTDLDRCVSTIVDAFRRSGQEQPKRPWLPPLPAELPLTAGSLARRASGRPTAEVVVGRVDQPARQQQPDLVLDLRTAGHVLVHGASGSGKTELLRTAAIAASVGDAYAERGVAPYVYAVDCAGGGLSSIGSLPTVAAVVTDAQPGRVMRLIRLLSRTVAERSSAIAQRGGADLDDLVAAGLLLPRVYVLVDNLPGLLELLEGGSTVGREHLEQLQRVLQNGRRAGVHVIATAPGRTGVPTATGASFGSRIVLRMTVADDYLMLGVPGRVLDADSAPGAGLMGKQTLQVASMGAPGSPELSHRLVEVDALLRPVVGERAPAPVPPMPSRVDQSLLAAPVGSRVALGVDADAVAPFEVDLLGGPLLVCGRARSGRTSFLDGLQAMLLRGDRPPLVIRASCEAGGLPAAADQVEAFVSSPESRDPEGSASWALLMVDDADQCDTVAGADQGLRSARDRLVAALELHGRRLGVVMTADSAEARQRAAADGLVAWSRRGRRGFLLQPDWSDGDILGVSVPAKTIEPITGPGRGLWCGNGTAVVAQLMTGGPAPEGEAS